jgi:predicted phage tail protein
MTSSSQRQLTAARTESSTRVHLEVDRHQYRARVHPSADHESSNGVAARGIDALAVEQVGLERELSEAKRRIADATQRRQDHQAEIKRALQAELNQAKATLDEAVRIHAEEVAGIRATANDEVQRILAEARSIARESSDTSEERG